MDEFIHEDKEVLMERVVMVVYRSRDTVFELGTEVLEVLIVYPKQRV
ncbi:hypothetical protein PP707_00010 [Acetobacter pasteurianus]|nr:hypothetical protein [Acetobacter pasteurianus]